MEIIEHFIYSWYGGIIVLIICSVILSKSCNVFEACTIYLGRNMNDGVKGASLNAIGSSMPELFTTVFFLAFATHEHLGRDFAASVGGDTGSAIFNSIVIPMLVVLVVLLIGSKEAKFSKKVILRDGLFLIAAEFILLILLSSDFITWWHGLVFTGFYVIYLLITFLFMDRKKNAKKDYNDNFPESWFERYQFKSSNNIVTRSWFLLIISTIIISIACAGIVESCKGIANSIGINPLFVALVLVAAASSIPDTIISMRDARKGNYDDALSNVLASNIFDITISMGLPLMIYLLVTGQKIDFREAGPTIIDIRLMLVMVTIITITLYYFSNKLKGKHVVILALLYAVFILYAIGAADYYSDGNSLLAKFFGASIEFLHQPGSVGDILQNIANKLTGSW